MGRERRRRPFLPHVAVLLDHTPSPRNLTPLAPPPWPLQVSAGSYHAITDMMPSLAVRYPYMCYGFLAALELATLGGCFIRYALRGLHASRSSPRVSRLQPESHSLLASICPATASLQR